MREKNPNRTGKIWDDLSEEKNMTFLCPWTSTSIRWFIHRNSGRTLRIVCETVEKTIKATEWVWPSATLLSSCYCHPIFENKLQSISHHRFRRGGGLLENFGFSKENLLVTAATESLSLFERSRRVCCSYRADVVWAPVCVLYSGSNDASSASL